MIKIILVFLLFISACKKNGTDVGNPFDPNQVTNCSGEANGQLTSCVPTPYIAIQVSIICQKLFTVYGINQDSCYRHIYKQKGLIDFIHTQFNTYQDLEIAYNERSILVNTDNFELCAKYIKEADSANPYFLSAYDINFPDVFENIHKILNLNTACLETYTEK